VDRLLAFDGSVDSVVGHPLFSPDGARLVFDRYAGGKNGLGMVPVDGGGKAVPIGPVHSDGGATPSLSFSPDGSMLLVTYPTEGKTWLLATNGGSDRQASWPGTKFQSWQRLAP